MPEKWISLTQELKHRQDQKLSCLLAFTGKMGMGKSYGALRVAQRIDPNFGVKNLVFTALDYLNLIRSSKPKSALIFDDAGVGFDAQLFYEKAHRYLSYALETSRYLQLVLILTMPSRRSINARARRLLDREFYFSHRGWAHEYDILDSGKRGRCICENVKFPLPSKKLISQYERKKSRYLYSLYKELSIEATEDRAVAKAKQLAKEGMKQIEISKKINRSQAWVSKVLRSK
jgi:hypothetical protein